MKRFFEVLAPDERITFQTFTDSENRPKPDPLVKIIHGYPERVIDALAELNSRGAGIYWMVNRGDGRGRRTGNVVEVRCPFVDLDGAPLGPVEEAAVPPRVIVQTSPGRYHAYWNEVECPLECFTAMQIALARHFGSDPSVSDLPRVLRVPGFLHQKGEPFMTRIERIKP